MALDAPKDIEQDPFKYKKWQEITGEREFTESETPFLCTLIEWYRIIQQCTDDMADAGGHVAYQNDVGDIKALPQIAIMRQASAEIRQLNKLLGLSETGNKSTAKKSNSILKLVVQDRQNKRAQAGR